MNVVTILAKMKTYSSMRVIQSVSVVTFAHKVFPQHLCLMLLSRNPEINLFARVLCNLRLEKKEICLRKQRKMQFNVA